MIERRFDIDDSKSCGREFEGDRQPAVAKTWLDAMLYCAWKYPETATRPAGRLPTQIEWERAAKGVYKGYQPGRKYPIASCQKPGIEGQECKLNPKEAHYNEVTTSEVGKYPPGPYGLHDMAGNVKEWTATCGDVDFSKGFERGQDLYAHYGCGVSGGSWSFDLHHSPNDWETTSHSERKADYHSCEIGFRCVWPRSF